MSAATSFARTPTTPQPFQLGQLLINGIAIEPKASARLYRVHLATGADHQMFEDDRLDALRAGYQKWFQHIVVTRLSDGHRWFFAERNSLFPTWEDTDEHAEARLAALARAEKLRPIKTRRWL
jgi:hypothetical protein